MYEMESVKQKEKNPRLTVTRSSKALFQLPRQYPISEDGEPLEVQDDDWVPVCHGMESLAKLPVKSYGKVSKTGNFVNQHIWGPYF